MKLNKIYRYNVFQREKVRRLVYLRIRQREKAMIVNLVPGPLWVSSTGLVWGRSRRSSFQEGPQDIRSNGSYV